MDIDFGAFASATVNANPGPVVMAPSISTFSYNMGLGLATIQHNEIYGKPNDFLWTINTWDDRIHTVID